MERRNKIGLVIPTLAHRPEMLIRSMTTASAVADEIVIVAPSESFAKLEESLNAFSFTFIEDPGRGLAAAINYGFQKLSESIVYAGWLGDDDGIYPEPYFQLIHELDTKKCVAVYGDCEYKSAEGLLLGTSAGGTFALKILEWGPDLIPQPTTVFSFEALRQVGFLNERYDLAFDYDLFLRLKRLGSIRHVSGVAGFFTWHEGSLSVSSRWASAREAHLIRLTNSTDWMRVVALIAGPIVMAATVFAGKLLSVLAGMKRG